MEIRRDTVELTSLGSRWILFVIEPTDGEEYDAMDERELYDEEIGTVATVTDELTRLVRILSQGNGSIVGPLWCTGRLGPASERTIVRVPGAFELDDASFAVANWSVCYLAPVVGRDESPEQCLAALGNGEGCEGCNSLSALYMDSGVKSVTAFVVDGPGSTCIWQRWEAGKVVAGHGAPGAADTWRPDGSEMLAIARDLLRQRGQPIDASLAAVLLKAGVRELASVFAEQQVTGEVLFSLSDGDLKELGVSALGVRKRILRAIAERRKALDTFKAIAEGIAFLRRGGEAAADRDREASGDDDAHSDASDEEEYVADSEDNDESTEADSFTEVAPLEQLELEPETPAPATWKEAVEAAARSLRGISAVEIAPAHDFRKLEGVKSYVPDFSVYHRVIFLYDDTLLRSGKDGMVASEHGIFWRNAFDKPGAMTWAAFESAVPVKDKVVLEPGSHTVGVGYGGSFGASAIARALNEAAPVVRAVLDWEGGAEQRQQERSQRAANEYGQRMLANGYRLRNVRLICGVCGGSGLCEECGRTGRCVECGGRGFSARANRCFGCLGSGSCWTCGGRAVCGCCQGGGAVVEPRWVR